MSLIKCHLNAFLKEFEKENQARIKAGYTATRVEGYRLLRLLQRELRSGSPGGTALAPLTFIASRTRRGPGDLRGDKTGLATKKPLSPLAVAMRYNAIKEQSGMRVEIGAVDTRRERLSESWKRIMIEQQEGTKKNVAEGMRHMLLSIGSALKNRRGKVKGIAKFFFLKKSTTTFVTPPRAIIDPFLSAHESEIIPNIRRNYERKLKGERI